MQSRIQRAKPSIGGTYYGRAPRGYSRSRAQRRGRRAAIRGRRFIPGYDRTGGFYGRYTQGGERKFFNTVVDDATVSANMTINNLTVVPEGNGESDRIGRKITIKSVHIKGTLTLAAATALVNTSDQVTCMLVQDTQTNGAAFVALDLIDVDTFDEFRNLANSSRFKVLYKKVYNLSAPGAAPTGAAFGFGEVVRSINVNKNVNIVMEYDNSATSGVITSVRTNNLYWVTQASTGVCGIVATARIRYADR